MTDITVTIKHDDTGDGDPVYIKIGDTLKRAELADVPITTGGTARFDMGVIQKEIVVSDSRRPNGKKPLRAWVEVSELTDFTF